MMCLCVRVEFIFIWSLRSFDLAHLWTIFYVNIHRLQSCCSVYVWVECVYESEHANTFVYVWVWVHAFFRHFNRCCCAWLLCFLFFSVGGILWQHIPPSALRPCPCVTHHFFVSVLLLSNRPKYRIYSLCMRAICNCFFLVSRLPSRFFFSRICSCEWSLLSFVRECVPNSRKNGCSMISLLSFIRCAYCDITAPIFALQVSPSEQTHEHNHSLFLLEISHRHIYAHSMLPFLQWNKCKPTFDTEHLTMDMYSIACCCFYY